MSSDGNGYDMRGEVARLDSAVGGLRDRMGDVESKLPRIEHVQAEVIEQSARISRAADRMVQVSDRMNHLASVTAQRFEQVGSSFNGHIVRHAELLTRQSEQIEQLTELVRALPKPKRRASR